MVTARPLGLTLVHACVPVTGFVGPLIAFLAVRDRDRAERESVVEALNFSIGYSVAVLASAVLTIIMIGAVLLPLVVMAGVGLCAVGAVATYRGDLYRYPVNIRLVS